MIACIIVPLIWVLCFAAYCLLERLGSERVWEELQQESALKYALGWKNQHPRKGAC